MIRFLLAKKWSRKVPPRLSNTSSKHWVEVSLTFCNSRCIFSRWTLSRSDVRTPAFMTLSKRLIYSHENLIGPTKIVHLTASSGMHAKLLLSAEKGVDYLAMRKELQTKDTIPRNWTTSYYSISGIFVAAFYCNLTTSIAHLREVPLCCSSKASPRHFVLYR